MQRWMMEAAPLYPYENNSDCSWLLMPTDSVVDITLDFLEFDLGNGDSLFIYDGEDSASPLIGVFTGTETPTPLTSSADKLFLKFQSDPSTQGNGWLISADYQIPVYCNGTTTLTDPAGSFSDGSGPRDYHNGSICMWYIQPENATEISLHFLSFDTEENQDFVKIYDGNGLIAEYSGQDLPDDVSVEGNLMLVAFISDNTGTAAGWEANYSSDAVQIKDPENLQLGFFPNPAYERLNIHGIEPIYHVRMYNLLQQEIFSEKYDGQNNIQIDVSGFYPGIYLFVGEISQRKIIRRVLIR
jgi:hypothetical protein